jgi:hypothetical protein
VASASEMVAPHARKQTRRVEGAVFERVVVLREGLVEDGLMVGGESRK